MSSIFFSKSVLDSKDIVAVVLLPQILKSDLIIVLWTKNALNSAFVNQELGLADAHNKMIVPIVETGILTHGLLAGREYISFERGVDTETYTRLCQSLSNFLQRKLEQQTNAAFGAFFSLVPF